MFVYIVKEFSRHKVEPTPSGNQYTIPDNSYIIHTPLSYSLLFWSCKSRIGQKIVVCQSFQKRNHIRLVLFGFLKSSRLEIVLEDELNGCGRLGINDKRGKMPNKTIIADRPAEAETKVRLGEWEGDTIIGGNHQSGVVTLVERKSTH